jgi:hypothetical protein
MCHPESKSLGIPETTSKKTIYIDLNSSFINKSPTNQHQTQYYQWEIPLSNLDLGFTWLRQQSVNVCVSLIYSIADRLVYSPLMSCKH